MVLRVKLEIVPFGEEDKMREIGRLDIFNKGSPAPGWATYGIIDLTPEHTGLVTAEISHLRHEGAWSLLRKVFSHPQIIIEGP